MKIFKLIALLMLTGGVYSQNNTYMPINKLQTTAIKFPSGKVQTDFDTITKLATKQNLLLKVNYADTLTKIASRQYVNNLGTGYATISFVNNKVTWNDSINVRIGEDAGKNNLGDYQNAFGVNAGKNNAGDIQNAIGYNAGFNNTGVYQNAFGVNAGSNNTGIYQNAIGGNAGSNNTGKYQNAIGFQAGNSNTADSTIFIGYKQGENNNIHGKISIDAGNTTKPLIDGFCVGDSMRINGTLIIANGGNFKLSKVVYDDILVDASQLKTVGQVDKPDYSTANLGLLFPDNDTTEAIGHVFQMPHRVKQGVINIFPHVHVIQTTADTAIFRMDYRYYKIGAEVPATWTRVTTKVKSHTWASGSRHQVLSFGAISIDNDLSGILDIKLWRSPVDRISGDVLLKQFDIHVPINKMGSSEEYYNDL